LIDAFWFLRNNHLLFLPGPETADSSAVFQRKQSFQAFDTRFALRCSAEDVPVIETHENEGRNELNKDEHRRQNAITLPKNLGQRLDHHIHSSPKFKIGIFAGEDQKE
jgi:hypothetical protein